MIFEANWYVTKVISVPFFGNVNHRGIDMVLGRECDDVGRDPRTDQAATAQGKDRHVEREFEIGKDEGWSSLLYEKDQNYFANRKRTYDEYQAESLEAMRQVRRHAEEGVRKNAGQLDALNGAHLESLGNREAYVQKILSDAQSHDNVKQNIAEQALQNAVETANMVSKQAVRHSDLAIDRQWNINETDQLSAKTGVQQDAIAAAVTAAVLDALKTAKTQGVL